MRQQTRAAHPGGVRLDQSLQGTDHPNPRGAPGGPTQDTSRHLLEGPTASVQTLEKSWNGTQAQSKQDLHRHRPRPRRLYLGYRPARNAGDLKSSLQPHHPQEARYRQLPIQATYRIGNAMRGTDEGNPRRFYASLVQNSHGSAGDLRL